MELLKTCAGCNELKVITAFGLDHRSSTPKRRARCNSCANKANLTSRNKNRPQYNKKARDRRNSRKLRAIEYKGGKCSVCGSVVHTAAFDFHHIDPEEKDTDPGLMMGLTDEKLFCELDKCILICSNCHRILHYEETNT